jgi:IS605 OrfB family transposase
MEAVKTLTLRIKDKHAAVLSAMAREVNFVWNYCNETSFRSIRERHRFLSGFDLQRLTAGYSKCEGVRVGSATVQLVCEEYATRRKQFKRARLNWRVSNPKSARRSLGWVPFKAGGVKYKAGQVTFLGHRLSLWDSYGLSRFALRAGSFAQDARGRWYLNVAVKAEVQTSEGTATTGIDLGLKTAATCSDGAELESGVYRRHEAALGIAQRAGKKGRVRAIHAKIANTRKDAMHKFSTQVVARSRAIFVGNVQTGAMVKTRMAKSVLDSGWSMLKTMLEYKSRQAGIVFEEVDEAYTTQTCSSCGVIPASSPKGRTGLGMRRWSCSECGADHHRDVNAARNIAAAGHGRLAGGIPVL